MGKVKEIKKMIRTGLKAIGLIIALAIIIFAFNWSDNYEWHNGTCRECEHCLKFDGTEFLKYDGTVYKYYCPNCHKRVTTHTHFEPKAELKRR